jgi:hypothetical protein
VLFALLAACGEPTTIVLALPLEGPPSGLALAPDGGLAVTHTDATGLRRISVYNPSSGDRVFGNPAGPGMPVVGDGRLYVLQDDGVTAFRGLAVDWRHETTGRVPNDAEIGLTTEGVVVFASQSGDRAALHAITHLGFELWTTPLDPIPRGAPMTDDGNVLYVAAGDTEVEVLMAIDADDGTVLWESATGGQPLVALEDGLIAGDGTTLVRYDSAGDVVWTAASDATAATPAGDQVWVSGGAGVERLELATGRATDSFGSSCGPIAVDRFATAWALCTDTSTNVPRLTSIDALPAARSAPIGEQVTPVDAPLLANGVSYALVGGAEPRLLGFATGASAPDGGWSRSTGGPTNDRRNTP